MLIKILDFLDYTNKNKPKHDTFVIKQLLNYVNDRTRNF